MSEPTKYPTIRVTEAQLWAATHEFDPEPIACERCDCALKVHELRTGLWIGMCYCCAARWLLDVVQ